MIDSQAHYSIYHCTTLTIAQRSFNVYYILVTFLVGMLELHFRLSFSVAGVARQLVHPDMSQECVSECWIRFLNLLGNPVDLCHPSLISSTPSFLELAMSSDAKDCDSSMKYFPCLRLLPDIFLQVTTLISYTSTFLCFVKCLQIETKCESADYYVIDIFSYVIQRN